MLLSAALLALFSAHSIDHANADARVALTGNGTMQYSDRLAPSAGMAIEVPSERAAVTRAKMQGRWLAQAEDGSMTVLELRPGGGFSFDRQAQVTPEREYMCGDWALRGGELALVAKTLKTRDAGGDIQLTEKEQTRKYTVLAARTDVLVLRTTEGTLTFHRRGA